MSKSGLQPHAPLLSSAGCQCGLHTLWAQGFAAVGTGVVVVVGGSVLEGTSVVVTSVVLSVVVVVDRGSELSPCNMALSLFSVDGSSSAVSVFASPVGSSAEECRPRLDAELRERCSHLQGKTIHYHTGFGKSHPEQQLDTCDHVP